MIRTETVRESANGLFGTLSYCHSLLIYRSKLITYRESQITFTISIPVGGIKYALT